MPGDTTYLYFQRGRNHFIEPYSASTGSWNNRNSQRALSVPRTSLTVHRASSVPRVSHRAHSLPPPQFNHVASVLACGRGVTGVDRRESVSYSPALYKHRTGGHSFTPSLAYTTTPRGSFSPVHAYTGVSLIPIHSYSQSKGGIIVTAPQRVNTSATIKSLVTSRPTAYYKAPLSSRGGAERARDWSARRGTSANRERVDNGYPRIKIAQSKNYLDNNGPRKINVDNGPRNVDFDNGPRKTNYDVQIDPFSASHKASMSDLRSRAQVARNQLSQHRVLLDRYLPISAGKPKDVDDEIANKYGELLIRMPQLEYSHRSRPSLEEAPPPLIILPYTPAYTRHEKIDKLAGLDLPPVKNSFTTKISDTRKNARRVLCKIKDDPRYFDFS